MVSVSPLGSRLGDAMAGPLVSVGFRYRLTVFCLAVVYSCWTVAKRLFLVLLKGRGGQLTSSNRRNGLALPSLNLPASERHSFVKINGVKLHLVEAGDTNAPPLLLLHGFPDCWLGWRDQIAFLADQYHVFAVDLKGFGDSDKPEFRLQYRLPAVVEELNSLLESITENTKFRSVTLLGHDLGGLLGWFLLHTYPDAIERFVVVSAPHPNVFWQSMNNNNTLNYKWMCSLQIPYLAELEALKDDVKFLETYSSHLTQSSSLLEAYKYVFSRCEDWTGPLHYFRNLIFWRIDENADLINTPVLLIIGSEDTQVSLESMVRSSEWCKDAKVKIIDGAKHFPHQEDPTKFNELLVKFLMRPKQPKRNGKLDNNSNELGVTEAAKGLVERFFGSLHFFS